MGNTSVGYDHMNLLERYKTRITSLPGQTIFTLLQRVS